MEYGFYLTFCSIKTSQNKSHKNKNLSRGHDQVCEMKLESFLKESLKYQTIKATNHYGGGFISQGQSFVVDNNQKIFVKQNSEVIVSNLMFLPYF